MSFKSLRKSKTVKKVVACILASAVMIGATSYYNCGCITSSNEPATAMVKVYSPNINDFIKPLSYEGATTTFTTTTTIDETIVAETSSTTSLGTTSVVTSTTTSEVTQSVTEAQTEEEIETPVEQSEPQESEEIQETTESPREYVVYKPSTHYIHKNTCRWCNSECYEILNTEGIEARRCSDCNPDIEIITPYEEQNQQSSTTNTAIAVTDYEYIILCNLVAGEYGDDRVSIYDKGAVAATVIHRMWEGTRWTGGASPSIYNVIAAPYQYDGKYLAGYYSSSVTQSCKDAVTYALNNIHDYDYYCNPDGTSVYMINSFCGDGRYNWFRCS